MKRLQFLLCVTFALAICGAVFADSASSMLDGLPTLKSFKAMRDSSSDPDWENGNGDAKPIPPGKTLTLAELKGPGKIAHIWFTIADNERFYGKKLVLKMYWDGEPTPSVESPLNDFFCQGNGMDVMVQSLPFRVTSDGRGRNCYFPMPFGKSARIQVTNEGKEPVNAFYFYIDWQKMKKLPKETAYFHAKYRQEYPCKLRQDYLILDAAGKGHYVGCNLSVHQREPGWWGEGDDRFYIDGETEPSLRGTGSEDYFCDGWGIRPLEGLYYGCTYQNGFDTDSLTTAYRFHIPDPVPFTKSLKVTIEHKGARYLPDGNWNGYLRRTDDFSSVAYWYQVEPHKEFFDIPSGEARIYPRMTIEIEGESLVPTAAAEGPQPVVQDLVGWSGGKQLFFTPADSKASVTVKFAVSKEGRYRVGVRLTKALDYGNYAISLDGGAPLQTVSLYSPGVALSPLVSLATQTLSQGEHTIKFQCVGKDDASKGHYFGLDVIELTPT